MRLKVKLLKPTASLPSRAYFSAGFDLYASDPVTIAPGKTEAVPLGICTEFTEEYVALLWDRGSMGKKGIHRFAGVVDSDYRGEWLALLYNSTDEPYEIKSGDKVVQMLFQRVEHPDIEIVGAVTDTLRGEGRFGSSETIKPAAA